MKILVILSVQYIYTVTLLLLIANILYGTVTFALTFDLKKNWRMLVFSNSVFIHFNVPHSIFLLFLMPDNFTYQLQGKLHSTGNRSIAIKSIIISILQYYKIKGLSYPDRSVTFLQ